MLEEGLRGQLDIETQCRGFLDVAKEAVAGIVGLIFADPGFAELFNQLYCSPEWRSGSTTASMVATIGDYLADVQKLTDPAFFRR